MIAVATQLKEIIDGARPSLAAIAEEQAAAKPYPDKWSFKEVLGHIIDSAANNHQRIVRLQESGNIGTFNYNQGHWVSAQRYQTEPWGDLVGLWYALNSHLSHVIAHVDPACLEHLCDIGYAKPTTLRFIIEDYVRHVEHHLGQILSGVDPQARVRWVPRYPR